MWDLLIQKEVPLRKSQGHWDFDFHEQGRYFHALQKRLINFVSDFSQHRTVNHNLPHSGHLKEGEITEAIQKDSMQHRLNFDNWSSLIYCSCQISTPHFFFSSSFSYPGWAPRPVLYYSIWAYSSTTNLVPCSAVITNENSF